MKSNEEIAEYSLQMMTRGMEKMLEARKTLASSSFVDFRYSELVHSPEAAMKALYDRLDLNYTAQAQAGISSWLSQGAEHTGRHHYQLEDFGLSVADIEERFSEYTDFFDRLLSY